jgi:hypothetical protein
VSVGSTAKEVRIMIKKSKKRYSIAGNVQKF